MKTTRVLSALGVLGFVANAAVAQSISPANYSATIKVGETITIDKTITLGARGASKVDVVFLADNTGSMGSIVGNAKTGANAILGGLASTGDFNFGVAHYYGDPIEGVPPATAFSTLAPLSASSAAAQSAINTWNANGGGDTPEANYYALQQSAATSAWRPDAQRIVVWFGDASSHTETTTQADAISALTAANAKVVAFNSTSDNAGIDGSYGSDAQQASHIVAATGGSLTNNFTSLNPSDFVTKVTDQIIAATTTVDLNFGSTLLGSGLSLSFICTDALGCDNVAGGESRTFKLAITGNLVGTYAFDVFAQGVPATEHDTITVTSVPEPESVALVLAGLGVCAWAGRRHRRAA